MHTHHAVRQLALPLLALLAALLGTGGGLPAAVSPETGQAPDTWQALGLEGAPSPRSYATTVWTGTEFIVWGGMGPVATWPQQTALYHDGYRYNPATGTWRLMSTVGAPSPRLNATGIWTGSELIIWGGNDFSSPLPLSPAMGGGRYDPVTDTWHALPPSGLSPRGASTVIWTGKELLVWGGTMDAPSATPGEMRWFSQSDGARYDPVTNTWRRMSTVGAPDGKYRAIWTGKELLVWSASPEAYQQSQHTPGHPGARYNPAADTWRPMSAVGAPPASAMAAVWTGTQLLVWGAANGQDARYDPVTDTWTPMSMVNAPTPRISAMVTWTGRQMLVWGGCCAPPHSGHGGFDVDGGLYDPRTDTWTPIGDANGAVAPESYATAWTGSQLVVWGGCCNPPGTTLGTGSRYDSTSGHWVSLPAAGAPTPRYGATAIWTGREVLIWGGYHNTTLLSDGATYRLASPPPRSPDREKERPPASIGR